MRLGYQDDYQINNERFYIRDSDDDGIVLTYEEGEDLIRLLEEQIPLMRLKSREAKLFNLHGRIGAKQEELRELERQLRELEKR